MTRRRLIVVATLVAALLAAVTGCQTGATDGSAGPGGADPGRAGPAPSASPSASAPAPEASPNGTAPAAGTRAVAVYYAAGGRLYREFHPRPRTAAVIREAVTAMLRERAYDPDYRSLWPAGTTVSGVSKAGNVVTVDLSAGPASTPALAVQQLVWTVTAADRSATRVRALVRGRPLTPTPVGRAPSYEVLGAVWVLAPLTGASVPRTFSVSGEATVFEATVSWELRQGGAVVRRGFATATTGAPGRGTWRATVTAPAAGSYQLVAFESSAKDGSVLSPDSKSITVR